MLIVKQKDVLQTLKACALSYDATWMSRYSITLWDALKFEVLSAQEPELADEALLVLREIAVCLSASRQTSATASPLAQYIRPIAKECIEHLQEPTHRQAKLAGDILHFVSSASLESFVLVAKAVIAPLLTIYESFSDIARHRALLEVFNRILDSAIKLFGRWTSQDTATGSSNPLNAFSEQLLQIFSRALVGTVPEEVSFRVTAAAGLQRLAVLRGLLQENEIGLIVQHLDEIVLEEDPSGRPELKRMAKSCLAAISKHKSRLIMDVTFPAFMAQLPDTDQEAEAQCKYYEVLEGLAEISVEAEVFETLVRRLLNKLDVVLSTENVDQPQYTIALLSTLLYVLEKRAVQNHFNIDSLYERVVVGLISRVTETAVEGTHLTALNRPETLDVLGRLSNLIVRHSTLDKKIKVGANVHDLFYLNSGLDALCQVDSESALQRLWLLSTWLLAALPRDLQAPLVETPNIERLLPRLLDVLDTGGGLAPAWTVSTLARARQAALLANKHLSATELRVALSQLQAMYHHLTFRSAEKSDSLSQPKQDSVPTVRLIFLISKALVLRLAPNTNTILENLVSLLNPSKYSDAVNHHSAEMFETLLASETILSKTNGAHIRLLAPQKIFNTLVPLMSDGFTGSPQDGPERVNYLTALSGVISTVPAELVVSELPRLLPLLLQSLQVSHHRVQTATLETLKTVITRSPVALADSGHVPSLTKRLVAISASGIQKPASRQLPNISGQDAGGTLEVSSYHPLPKARQLATRCLFLMPHHLSPASLASAAPSATASSAKPSSTVSSSLMPNPLLSLKHEVVHSLAQVLDDPKRDVRKEAVDARAAWLRGVDDDDDDDGGEEVG